MRQIILYTYRSRYEFSLYQKKEEAEDREVYDLSYFTNDERNKSLVGASIDITNLIRAIYVKADRRHDILIFLTSDLCKKTKFIIRNELLENAKEVLYTILGGVEELISISEIDSKDAPLSEDETRTQSKRIIDLNDIEMKNIYRDISNDLFGHHKFKTQFWTAMEDFELLNKIGEQKILSVMLLGPSGVGKTEFGRILHRYLGGDTKIIKINFGNLSSKDSLNSLIGSPRGYVGSEEGELSKKIPLSNAGVILCDEFEKGTAQIFNFFLEMLEDGSFTDSQGELFDLTGYIIIFTTNLTQKDLKKFPPELRSRIDLICEFEPLSLEDKQKFIEYHSNSLISKFKDLKEYKDIPFDEIDILNIIDYQGITNIRELRRIVRQQILEFTKQNKKEKSI